jgi:digeranylgeranylglycerophospholipid reductase
VGNAGKDQQNIMSESIQAEILVIGAGPAGLMAAISAASAGRSVCLIEREAQAGVPVRCGEGIGLKGLLRSLELNERWIKHRVRSVRMVSPAGIAVDLREFQEGLILDRARMEQDLFERAAAAGARCVAGTTIVDIKESSGTYACRSADGREFISSCVILAEGVESRLGRQLGWHTVLGLEDLETCAFAHVRSPEIAQDSCGFFLGKNIAPGGYAWIFPRGDGTANVGLGVLASLHSAGSAQNLLDAFIEARFTKAEVYDRHCGAVPVGRWLSPLVRGGVMLAGDSARQVNCLHGGGIAFSLFAGKTAGTAAARAFQSGTFDRTILSEYENTWRRMFGNQQRYSYSLKSMVINFADHELDAIARSLVHKKRSKITYMMVLMRACAGHPVLMLKAFLMAR